MQKNRLKKIVIIGPESTGKSTLCKQLAAHYNTRWVQEYAREYLPADGKYMYADLHNIAEGQMKNEEELTNSCIQNSLPLLFIDTDLYVIKIWSEFVFNDCDNRILMKLSERVYDLYLLCDTDLPWEPDPLREYPDLDSRVKLFHYYKDAMINQQVPWVIINGSYEERLKKAIEAVNTIT